MIVFYLTCAAIVIVILGTVISNIAEDVIAHQPRQRSTLQPENESWKTYRSK